MTARNPDTPLTNQRPRFLWWRFALVAAVLSVLGFGFCVAWYCDPPPTLYQQVIFVSILILMLIQTVQAGWYRSDDPWEVDVGLRILVVIAIAFFVAIVIVAIVFIMMFVDSTVAPFVLLLLFFLVAVVWLILANENSKG